MHSARRNEWLTSLSKEKKEKLLKEEFTEAVESTIERLEYENAVRMLPPHLRQVYEENVKVVMIQARNGYFGSRHTFDIVSDNLNLPRNLFVDLLQTAAELLSEMLEDEGSE